MARPRKPKIETKTAVNEEVKPDLSQDILKNDSDTSPEGVVTDIQEEGSQEAPVSPVVEQSVVDLGDGITQQENAVNVNTEASVVSVGELPTREYVLKAKLSTVVKEIMFIASLGGNVKPGHLPRLSVSPATIIMQVPTESWETFLDRDPEQPDPSKDYNTFTISSVDVLNFVKELVSAGSRGALPVMSKIKFTAGVYSAQVVIDQRLVTGPNVSQLGKERPYTSDELKSLSMFDLRLIAQKYNVSHRDKNQLVRLILDSQDNV